MSSSGSAPAGFERIKFTAKYLKNNTIGKLFLAGLGSMWVSFSIGINRIIDTIALFYTEPVRVVIDVGTGLFAAIVGAPIKLMDYTINAVGPLLVARFDFLAPFVAVVMGYGILWITIQFLEERETSNLVPGTFTDFPLVGTTEEGETDDE